MVSKCSYNTTDARQEQRTTIGHKTVFILMHCMHSFLWSTIHPRGVGASTATPALAVVDFG